VSFPEHTHKAPNPLLPCIQVLNLLYKGSPGKETCKPQSMKTFNNRDSIGLPCMNPTLMNSTLIDQTVIQSIKSFKKGDYWV